MLGYADLLPEHKCSSKAAFLLYNEARDFSSCNEKSKICKRATMEKSAMKKQQQTNQKQNKRIKKVPTKVVIVCSYLRLASTQTIFSLSIQHTFTIIHHTLLKPNTLQDHDHNYFKKIKSDN